MTLIRILLPLLAGVGCAWWIDRSTAVRGLLPPGFAGASPIALRRRVLAMVLLALVLSISVFAAVSQIVLPAPVNEIDFERLSPVNVFLMLFLMHAILVVTLSVWMVLGYRRCGHDARTVVLRQLGLRTRTGQSLPVELGIGFGTGVVLWAGVLFVLLITALLVGAAGGFENLPNEAPEMVLWMGSLPVLLRLMVSLSAGVVEEVFFRGFLMPRAGFVTSNVLFVLAHLSYEQPFMLLGVALLSVGFSYLTIWRGNIWPAIAAHFLFDAIQLLILVPTATNAAGSSL
ncbi:MAG: CPBP family intramembrane metalloprotease [Holophagales bacterium]|nr:CPBP family intramembrane metalloprotease [Holophagales bacterium]